MTATGNGPELRVVIAIVSMRGLDHLTRCLRSLAAQKYRNFRVIVCENGGREAFRQAGLVLGDLDIIGRTAPACGDSAAFAWTGPCRHLRFAAGPAVTLLEAPRNLGFAGGVNAVIAAAGESWDAVWVLNPDTLPEPGALGALVRRQQQGGYGVVGSRLLFAESGLVQTWGGLEWRSWLGRGRLLGLDQPAETLPDVADVERRIAFVSGASMYVTRAYVEAVGPMDSDFFMYGEDVDWCLRRGSFRLGYAHRSVVRHVHGASSGSSTQKARRSRLSIYLSERNRVLLARKRFGAGWGIPVALALAQSLEYLLRVGSFRQFRIALAGWWAGMRGETGMPPFMQSRE
jgi:N-acetylglucosaminyl-diphospho-decaprenol L-rhamnosyltransferase